MQNQNHKIKAPNPKNYEILSCTSKTADAMVVVVVAAAVMGIPFSHVVNEPFDVRELGEPAGDGDGAVVPELVLLLRLLEEAGEQRVVQVVHRHDHPPPLLAFAADHDRHLPLPHLPLPVPRVVAPKVQIDQASLHLPHLFESIRTSSQGDVAEEEIEKLCAMRRRGGGRG